MKPIHVPPSSSWAVFDAQLLRQLHDDLELVAERNGAEFVTHFRPQAAEAWRDAADAKYDRLPTPGAELARRLLPVDRDLIDDVFQWCRHRRRMRELAAEIHREAERLRNTSA